MVLDEAFKLSARDEVLQRPYIRKTGIHPNFWYPVARSDNVKTGKPHGVSFAREPIVDTTSLAPPQRECSDEQKTKSAAHCWQKSHADCAPKTESHPRHEKRIGSPSSLRQSNPERGDRPAPSRSNYCGALFSISSTPEH